MATIVSITPEQRKLEQPRVRNFHLAAAVKRYPDYRLDTPDGRTFFMVLNDTDGAGVTKLEHLILAEGSTTHVDDEQLEQLEEKAALICSDDVDMSARPMVYSNVPEAIRAWREPTFDLGCADECRLRKPRLSTTGSNRWGNTTKRKTQTSRKSVSVTGPLIPLPSPPFSLPLQPLPVT